HRLGGSSVTLLQRGRWVHHVRSMTPENRQNVKSTRRSLFYFQNTLLAIVQGIQDQYNRARVLIALARRATGQLLSDVLSAVEAMDDEGYRALALEGLAPLLPTELLDRAVTLATATENYWSQVGALTSLIVHLPEPSRSQNFERIWSWAMTLPEHDLSYGLTIRPAVLARLAPCAPANSAQQVLSIARNLPTEERIGTSPRAGVLADIAGFLPEPLRCEALDEAIAVAQTLPQRNRYMSSPREQALASVALRAAELGYLDCAVITIGSLEDVRLRREALARLAIHLVLCPLPRLGALWQELLPILASRTRQNLSGDLRQLKPVLAVLGKLETFTEVCGAIEDVGRWWP
ncbi:MAG: hypothetical protein NT169_22635, partial [Chloroflexi bacterium]|nr:hypothetical protein [Chloroflexota bacterium]